MIKHPSYFHLITASFIFLVFLSCNFRSGEVPFPEKELGYTQPVAVPLQFTASKKLVWDTARKGGVKPVIKKLDINSLPSAPYDTTATAQITNQPEQTTFDYNNLPATAFNIDTLSAIPLFTKTSLLAQPVVVRTGKPVPQKSNRYSFFDFGPAQGLQGTFITTILKDRYGLMWVASNGGLLRYDGERVESIIPGPTNNLVAGMAEDNNGNIWLVQDNKITKLDYKHGLIYTSPKMGAVRNNLCKITKSADGHLWLYNKFTRSVCDIDPDKMTFRSIGMQQGLADTSAYEMVEDAEKRIWISTYRQGINIIDTKAGQIKHLGRINGLSSDTLTAVTKDKDGKIWVAESSGKLNLLDVKTGTIKHYNAFRNQQFYTFGITFDHKGQLWKNTSGGLEILDFENGRMKFFTKGSGLAGLVTLGSIADNTNRMWVPTTEGLTIIDQDATLSKPLGETVVITMMDDPVGNLWVGTDHGIILIDQKNNITRKLDETHGLGDNFIQSFVKYKQQIMIATNGGLDVVDPVNKTIEHTGKKEGLVSDSMYVVFKDSRSNTWITGPRNGIDLLDSAMQVVLHSDVKGGLNDDNIQDAKEDADGSVWLASNVGGVNVIDLKSGTVKYLNNQPGLKDTCNKMMLVDASGRIWIGTDKGVYVADIKNNTLTAITTKEGLASNNIKSLLEYNGAVIVGTNNKSCMITPPKDAAQKWEISILEKTEGFIRIQPTAWSTDCISQTGQYLWGDRGLFVINDIKPNNNNTPTYITGMNVMTRPQYFKQQPDLQEQDTIWTSDTFYVKGQSMSKAGYSQPKKISWDSVGGAYNLPQNLTLNHDDNYLQFQFTQPHLGRPDTTWYSYILKGIDKNWSVPSINTYTENYLNLGPGKYSFKVSSKAASGKWGTPDSFSFTILPPWYNTWWAYTIFVLLGAAVLRAYIVYRSKQLKKENRLLEDKVQQRTQQLQQSLEDLKATQAQLIQSEKMASLGELTAGIAHEIQNPLNFINNFSEVNTELIGEMKDEIAKGNLEEVKAIAEDIEANEAKINHHGKRADGIVKGMLLHSRSGNKQKEPTDINMLTEEYLRLAYHGLRAKDKSFNANMHTDFDKNVGNINVITQDIGRVILNLITNAFYSVTQKKKTLNGQPFEPSVTVSTKKLNHKIMISVKDNGNGVPAKVLDKIFQPFFTTKPSGEGTGLGLSLSYDIIKAHGGELKVETKEGEGAEFIIILPQ